MDYHIRYFEELAKRLSPYTRQCTINFIDLYRNTARNMASLDTDVFCEEQQEQLAKILAEIAHSYGLRIVTCAEKIDLGKYGIEHAHCVNGQLFEKLLKCSLHIKKTRHKEKNVAVWKELTSAFIIPVAMAANAAMPIIWSTQPILTGKNIIRIHCF